MKKKLVACVIGFSLLLSACGGGGSGDVVVSKPGVSLSTTAPTTLNVDAGVTSSYKVNGGGNGSAFTSYSASSSNPSVATATITGSDMSIVSLSGGTATITVKDSSNNSIDIKVNVVVVVTPNTLSIQAPSVVTLNVGSSVSYKVIGGSGALTAVSSNIGVSQVSVNADNSISVKPVAAGGAQIVVYDQKGSSASITSTVAAPGVPVPLFVTSPSFISLTLDSSSPTYKIGGGTAPYTVTSSSDVIAVDTNNDAFTIKTKAVGFASLAVKDATGTALNMSVAVVSGRAELPFYTSAPSSVVIRANESNVYTIAGGTAPYIASSSDTSVAQVGVNDTSFTIRGISKGSASIVVKDRIGAVISISAVVPDPTGGVETPFFSTAPGSVTLQAGTTSNFVVFGGKPSYAVSSSDESVAKGTIKNGSVDIKAIAAGTANIIVSDSVGSKINIAVTIPAGATPEVVNFFTTAPPSLTLSGTNSGTFAISGGVAPYSVTSNATSVVTATVSGSSFTITGVAPGNASVLVLDKVGTVINIAVTVPSPTNGQLPTPLFSTSPSSVTIKEGSSAAYSIGGGKGPYTVTSSAAAVVTVQQSGNRYSLTGVGTGTATIAIVDSTGTSVSISVTVN